MSENVNNPRRVYEAFQRRGIRLSVGPEGHLEASPAHLLSPADLVRLSELKANLLQYLRAIVRRF